MWTGRVLPGRALISAVLIPGCAGGSPGGGSGTQTVAVRASVTPTQLAPAGKNSGPARRSDQRSPFDGGVASGTVTASVQVTGFALVPLNEPNRPGTGHLVDDRDATPRIKAGEAALTASGTYATGDRVLTGVSRRGPTRSRSSS